MRFYERLLEHIEEDLIPEALQDVRAGHYIAAVTGVYRSFRRLQIKPEWNDDPIDWTVRVASPILDVLPAAGTRMAVLSQDGAVDYAATIGQIWDELAPRMTVWIRAHLGTQPGRLEVGAERSIHIRAGTLDAVSNEAADSLGIEELPDGTIRVEVASGARIELRPDGDVVVEPASGRHVLLGAGATQALARADKVDQRLAEHEGKLAYISAWANAAGSALTIPFATPLPAFAFPTSTAVEMTTTSAEKSRSE